ncbi:MAG: DNA-3-methyladenine glycosylase 2 family protein [Hyphomicrobiales bacterium]|nr:DNA-3-methyladenine glycosylase 2 family protein [Hyphomicrobiales bacterium]
MAAGTGRKKQARLNRLPSLISTEADLAAHISALVTIHPAFDAMHKIAGDVPVRRTDCGFRGLFWIITGQQISVAAGRAIFARAEAALDALTPDCVLTTQDTVMKSAGLSAPKIRTLRAAADAIRRRELDIDNLHSLEASDAIAQLCSVKGVGRWTAEVYLLFALGHPDVFPAGDLALKEGVRLGFNLPQRPGEKDLVLRAEAWRPLRSAAARLTWAYYGAVKRGGDATPA